MNRTKASNILKSKHFVLDSAEFSVFTKEELQKLCIMKILTPLTFDNLGHPIAGGLYDKNLGPINDLTDPCGTCYKNVYECPGHFGYIELPLPVVNPLFAKLLGTILKISCLRCFSIQIPSHIKHSLALQIKLLNCGLVTEALEIEARIAEIVSIYKSLEKVPENVTLPMSQYEEIAQRAYDDLNGKIVLNKTTENLRHLFLHDLHKQIRNRKFCMFCKQPMDRIQLLRNRIVQVMNRLNLDSSKDRTKVVGKVKAAESKFVTPEESKYWKYMREIWKQENELMQQLVPVLKNMNRSEPTDIFFFEIVPVPPPNLRPVNYVNGRVTESPQTELYKLILNDCMVIKVIVQVIQNEGNTDSLPIEAKSLYTYTFGDTPLEKLNMAWETLQTNVNNIVDKSQGQKKTVTAGLKQIIEKKEGIIRKHMMGKRVNFAARSVITPDPNLNVDEIGVPETFAKRLTYPVPVTSWNVQALRKMIENGPDVHPGAVMVEFENNKIIRLDPKNTTQIDSILKRLLTPDEENSFKGVKLVYRHLCNGDIMLLNRQPTLHKPSIMAHTARILKGEKTFRLHYANCKAYNADFDGDEMNAHFPQNELARSEGYNLADVAHQYLVPKDGTPLSGLIQDHMISGVRLSIRGKFFSKYDYQQLVFQALSNKTSEIITLPPCIIKPMELWSGKQILSTVIINIIPKGKALINLKSTSKIPVKAWQTVKTRKWKSGGTPFEDQNTMTESEVIIRNGELLTGVLDKTHYGATPYGLIHCIYELYGGKYATKLLSALAKLFTYFLQRQGFTLGVRDILVLSEADEKRRQIVEDSRKIGRRVITEALDLSIETSLDEIAKVIDNKSTTNPKLRAIIDRQYKSSLDSFTNDINKTCLPAGLICKFPENNLQLMVQSGAKGSTVNTMQISCLLGQIELEGKRPPVMICGKSLPSFPAFEFSPRAGGFIDGRFMTGIQPQEFFFHCMAGREGLIDTAVKTSRSGYLQRCLIKHLEGLKVSYDMTVRDSDNSVIQFMYGEDGLDIPKAQFLNKKQMSFLMDNYKAIVDKDVLEELKSNIDTDDLANHTEKIENWIAEKGSALQKNRSSPFSLFTNAIKNKVNLTNPYKIKEDNGMYKISAYFENLWRECNDQIKNSFKEKYARCPMPLNSVYQPDVFYGSINERLMDLVKSCQLKKKSQRKEFMDMLKLKAMQALCSPGEPVGLLAAQSIGEPSTQMTLNTFHFAGRGEMNVTLGIPRLREILMVASKNLKTPSMEMPFLNVPDLERKAEHLRKVLTKVVVADVLENVIVVRELDITPIRQERYTLRFEFLPHKYYKHQFHVKPKYIINYMTRKFFGRMFTAIKKNAKSSGEMLIVEDEKKKLTANPSGDDSDDDQANNKEMSMNMDEIADDSSDEEPEDVEDAKLTNKYNETHNEQEPEEGEENLPSDDEDDDDGDDDQEASKLNADNDDEDGNVDDDDDEKVTIKTEKVSQEDLEKDREILAAESRVLNTYNFAKSYNFDGEKYLWCQLTFALPIHFDKVDLNSVLKDVAAKAVLWEVPNINRAITYMKDNKLTLRTDGINMAEMFKYNNLLDLNRLFSNDIHKVAGTYGIEAAQRVIVKEVQDVFNVYGITVDPRHLSLIADYMTFNGTYEPLNRTGMESDPSPLHQMSFESSLQFLKGATIMGKRDQLQNPSSCLVVGKPCYSGTGAFTLLQKLTPPKVH